MNSNLIDTSVDQPIFAQEHGLAGYLYKEYDCVLFESHYKQNLQLNLLLLDQWRDLRTKFEQAEITVIPLKGIYLVGEIYKDAGLRPMTDIDLLFPNGNEALVQNSLEASGFKFQPEKSWYGNRHKQVYTKDCGFYNITLEAHYNLFWHTKGDIDFQGPADHLLFLMGHLAFQHNFLKMFWLLDIYKYGKKYQHQIDWPKFFAKAEKLELKNSALACLQGVRVMFDEDFLKNKITVRVPLWCRILMSKNFLKYPRRPRWRYFLMKFMLKDKKRESLRYLLHWLKHKIFK